jgi:hypothetical protein
MSDNTQTPTNPLDHAEAQLREICESHAQLEEPIDTGSLKRMLVHIHNINASVCASTRDHVNAAKRLTDFSVTLGRLARKTPPIDQELAMRMTDLAKTLQTAGAEIADGVAMPRWTSPARDHAALTS